jgi:ABC-type Fe3+/spermidine/putrescine transport system ATPase subunit
LLREEMQVELRRIHSEVGTTFIYVTHDQEEALSMADRLVVMRDGRIEQDGPPQEVYDAPTNLWVAQFVGSSNPVAGVVRADGPEVELKTDLAVIRGRHVHGTLAVGDRAVATVRPERLRLEPDGAEEDGVNSVSARLEELHVVGGQIRAVAATPGGIRFTARLPREGAGVHGASVGDAVRVTWDVDAVHLYPTFDEPFQEFPQPISEETR